MKILRDKKDNIMDYGVDIKGETIMKIILILAFH